MFNDLMREIKRLEQGVTFSVPVEPDDEGYLDKECPSEVCQFQFGLPGATAGKYTVTFLEGLFKPLRV